MAEVIQIDYTPSPKQQLFHGSSADEVLYGGAAGGGKSKAIVMEAFMRCMEHAGTHAYLFRRTYRELEDTLILEAKRSIPDELGKYAASAKDFRLKNGSVLHFRHLQNSRDLMKYQGAEIHWLFIDELTHFTLEEYNFLKTRLRASTQLNIKPVVRCASNPGGIGHSWVKQRFIDAGEPLKVHENREVSQALGRESVTTLQYIPARATDNPYISEDYILELERKPPKLRDAYLYGKWDVFEGQVFTEFVNDPEHYHDHVGTHVISPFPIPDHWPRWRSFDHGYTRPFSVGWWAVGPDGTLYRYREWYGCTGQPDRGLQLTPIQIADGIAQREADERRRGIRFSAVADPAIWDASRGESVALMMESRGVYFTKAENARLSGKMQLHYRLKMTDGVPRMYIFSTCKDFIRTIPALAYSRTDAEDVDTASEDHIYDETRYMLMEHKISAAPKLSPPRIGQLDPLDMRPRPAPQRDW